MLDTKEALISVNAVEKVFSTASGGTVRALEDISIDIRKQEFIALVGPSGCGKSTLLRLIAGLEIATQGTITLAGDVVTGPTPNVGMVFQKPVLFPWWTVLENMLLATRILPLEKEKMRERAFELIELMGLSGFEDSYPYELSGGMQQRAAIGRALLHDPEILLMDEPFGALDAMTRENLDVELHNMTAAGKKTVVFVTHSIPEAVFLADRVVVFSERPATVAGVVEVNLPKPRTIGLLDSAELGQYTLACRELLGSTSSNL